MRVLLLGPYPPPGGGVQTNLTAIRRHLLQKGVPCTVINLTRHRQADHDGVLFPRSALGVLRLLAAQRFDVAHLHIGGNIPARLLALCLALTLRPGARTVLTLHSGGYPASTAGRRAGRWTLRGLAFRRFDRIIAVNQALKNMFTEKFGVDAARVRLIAPHSLPEHPPEVQLPPPVETFFRTHGKVLVSTGWLEPEYDFPLQIRALGAIRQRVSGAGLMILGAGRLEESLRGQINATPYAEHVLLAGDVPHEAAMAALARCGLFLRTAWYDGDSVSVREALHFGTPVIATDNGMRPAGVRLIPVADLDALVEAAVDELGKGRRSPSAGRADDSGIHAVYDLYRELAG
ncbi:MAG: glycosyltransferase [Bryobacterales bacterium]|nr:glycosyltransferase [Bryobacterales bacterium]